MSYFRLMRHFVWAIFLVSFGSIAQTTYPEKPIKILQGFAPGGNADTIARLVSAELTKNLHQSIYVEAQTGAGGTLAAGTVARANPDGYTLLLATGGHAVAGALFNKLPYKTVEDFEAISSITYFPFLLVTLSDSPYKSLSDLLKAAKDNPNSISYGTAGVGSTHHLAGELLAKMAKVQLMHVPYRGDAASLTALLSGEVPFIIAPPTAVNSQIKSGKLKILAVTGSQRWSYQPNIPTVAEQGVTGYDVSSWAALLAPAKTPEPIIKKLNEEMQKVLQVQSVKDRLAEMGGEVRGSSPIQLKAMIALETKRWAELITSAKIPKQ